MIEKYIKALEEIKEAKIHDKPTCEIWKSKAVNIIVRIYGEGSKQEEQVKSINYWRSLDKSYNNSESCNSQAKGLIEGFIGDLNRFGLPEKISPEANKSGNINITLNQSQTQNQSIKLNIILEALQDELNGRQLKELQEIIDNEEPIEQKKDSIVDKIKNFGSGLASNILANILTNPNLYS